MRLLLLAAIVITGATSCPSSVVTCNVDADCAEDESCAEGRCRLTPEGWLRLDRLAGALLDAVA